MTLQKDIEAEIYFLTTEEGGKTKPAFNDFSLEFSYNNQNWVARHTYPDVAQVNPGDTVRTYLQFLSPKEHLGKVTIGMKFEVREGIRTVGKGIVTNILELEQSANNAK